MTLSIVWIPVVITIVSLISAWNIGWKMTGGTYMQGIGVIFCLVPALFISMVSWIVWGIFK